MSRFPNGLRIQNIQCASAFECNAGVRDQLDTKNAVIANSLFLDFLLDNGLNVWKEKSTRDLIVLEFGYGTRSYEDERKHFDSLLSRVKKELDGDMSDHQRKKVEKKLANIQRLSDDCDRNKDEYVKISKQDLRVITYKEGITINYYIHSKGGMKRIDESIHYKMLTRTPGKAKKGRCMYIRDELYDAAREFLYMGITLPEHDAQIVEIGAYSSLVTSGLVGRIRIEPENILVLKDVESHLTTNVTSVETNARDECEAISRSNYELTSVLFDGQGLISSEIFPDWGNRYLLLRHHMTKCACLKTEIQQYFKDYFGDAYETATVTDMWGNEHLVKNIKLITTDNALKWLKFDVSYETWCKWVHKNDCMFGTVKTAHFSKHYPKQKMSYQMVNALDIETMYSTMNDTREYLETLQSNDDAFLDYLRQNINFSNDYEVLIALVEQDRDFIRSDYFRARKKQIINAYVINMKTGKLLQNAENLVIFGSPYAMLLHAVGEDVTKDPTFEVEDDCIQCWTGRFNDGEYLAEFRSPFNCRANMGVLKNHYHPLLEKYFDIGDLTIAVNLQKTPFQDRN